MVDVIPVTSGGVSVSPPVRPGVPTGGSTGQVLTKKSNTSYDVDWEDGGGGGGGSVNSVFGRTGAVTAQTGDYTAAQVGADASGAAAAAQAASQPLDSDLTAIAALTTTPFGRAFLALADAAATRTAIGTVIGTDVEAHDADLTTIAGLSPTNDDVLQRKAGAWTNRSIAQLLTDLGIAASYQPLDSDLTAIAALTTTTFGRSLLTQADAAATRTTLGLGTAALISSTAGGDLSGTLPSPTVVKINGTSLAALATGIVKNTTTTGVPSIAAAADIPTVAAGSTGPLSATDATTTNTRTPSAASIVDAMVASGAAINVDKTADGTTNKVYSATDKTRLANTSGTNTGDQTIPVGGTPAVVLAAAAAAGVSPNFLRRDDTIVAFDATAPSTQAFGDSAAVGTAAVAARRDHKHGIPATTKDTTAQTGLLKGNGTTISAVTAPAGAVVGTTDTQALTNKDLSGVGNTFPTFNQNTSGTAANLSGTPALPNGVTATTQTALDNSTKLGTTAYVEAAVAVEKSRALAAESGLLPLTGGTMSGPIAMGAHKVTGVTNGSASDDAAAFGQIPVVAVAAPLVASSSAPVIGASGKWADGSHVHPRYEFQAQDHGLLAWAYDPIGVTTTSAPTAAGTLQVVKLHCPLAVSVTNILLYLGAGTGLTTNQCLAGLFQGGTLLGSTADQSVAWASSGPKTMAISGGPIAVAAGDIYIAFYANQSGGGLPTFGRANGISAANFGLATANSRFATADTGRTTSLPGTLGTLSVATIFAFWAGIS